VSWYLLMHYATVTERGLRLHFSTFVCAQSYVVLVYVFNICVAPRICGRLFVYSLSTRYLSHFSTPSSPIKQNTHTHTHTHGW
jgi:hypothetical protein